MEFTLSSKMEQDIMALLWDSKKWLSGAEFWEYFNNHGKICKRQTVNTYLTRMADKGLLVKKDTKYMYAYTREEFESEKAKNILDTMYGGSLKKLVVALTGNKKLSKADAAELRKYLDDMEQ